MNDSLLLYKLMILYMLHRVQFPLTNTQMLQFFQDRNYTDYFTFSQAFNELNDVELISSRTSNNVSHCEITPSGEETINLFSDRLSQEVKRDIDAYLKENQVNLRNESGVRSEYHRSKGGDYIVRCEVNEGRNLIYSTEISVPTEEMAIRICDNWMRCSQSMYNFAVKTLFK